MIGRWSCRHPLLIKCKLDGTSRYQVRCNQCVNCILRRKAVWTGRNHLEWLAWGQTGSFVTLTYDEEHIRNHSYRDVQLYLKRLRTLQKVRFYAAPDTGDQFGRFHWHLLLYSSENNPRTLHAAKMEWGCGSAHVAPILPERIGYTCGYVAKKLGKTFDGRQNCSLGLGMSYFLARGRKLATEGRTLQVYPRMFKIGKSRFPLDATCRRALKKGYQDAGGVVGPKLDLNLRPNDYDIVLNVLASDMLGGMQGDRLSEERELEKIEEKIRLCKGQTYNK